jgi:hypothetical protein
MWYLDVCLEGLKQTKEVPSQNSLDFDRGSKHELSILVFGYANSLMNMWSSNFAPPIHHRLVIFPE